MRRFLLFVLFCLAALATHPPSAAALPAFPPIVLKTYQPKAGGAVAGAAQKCSLCHVQVPKLNPYGLEIRAALKAAGTKTLTPEILHSVDEKDSDNDGATNAQEIAADTLPGDPASKPAVIIAPKSAVKSNAAATGDEPNPWAIQTLLFPKHAQHPVVVHFPIALLLIGLFFDALGVRTRNRNLHAAAYYNIAAAAFFAPVTVLTGLGAWWFGYGHPWPMEGNLLYHLILGITSMFIIWGLWFLRRNELREETLTFRRAYIILGVLALPVIAITGHLGGILSGN